MLLEVLARFVLADRRRAKALIEIRPDAQRIAASAWTRASSSPLARITASSLAPTRAFIAVSCCSTAAAVGSAGGNLDTSFNSRCRSMAWRTAAGSVADFASISPNSTSACTSVCVMASVPIRASTRSRSCSCAAADSAWITTATNRATTTRPTRTVSRTTSKRLGEQEVHDPPALARAGHELLRVEVDAEVHAHQSDSR